MVCCFVLSIVDGLVWVGLGNLEKLKVVCITPGLHNKIPALKIFARGWVAQESIFLHCQR